MIYILVDLSVKKFEKKKSKKFVAEISASKLFGDFHQQ
jgi:hypothetical protein